MDEQERPHDPIGQPDPIAQRDPVAGPPQRSPWRRLFGSGGALLVAFVWGALTYREFAPTRVMSASAARPANAAVRGVETAPEWIGHFAKAFCDKDADFVAEHLGGPMEMSADQVSSALAQRTWQCTGSRFLGGGSNSDGEFFIFVLQRQGGEEMWFVFSTEGERVVGVD